MTINLQLAVITIQQLLDFPVIVTQMMFSLWTTNTIPHFHLRDTHSLHATKLMSYSHLPPKITNMKGLMSNSIRAQENRAAEHGLLWLQEKGHPKARRLCMKKFKDLSGKVSQIPVHVPSMKRADLMALTAT